MTRISILRPEVADQIAAGEVVERPSSVVKELVENALDAGATRIEIEIERGGRDLIRVADNGHGMDRDDALQALERHATSKIRSVHDLIGVGSFGFRGEALPAIASVSQLVVETGWQADPGGGIEATMVTVRGGGERKVESTARQRGTTVTVRRLFYNTPARLKFLRAQSTETRAIQETVTSLALARLDVAFKLTVDGRAKIEVPPTDSPRDRIALLFNRKLSEGLLDVTYHTGPLSVTGLIQRPADAKTSGRKVHFFVNGRPFKDPFLIRAAEAGYRTAIAPGLRPTLILHLDIAGDQVDVNVHPAKLEVRFRDKYFVERTVEQAVRDALAPVEASAAIGAASPSWAGEMGAVVIDSGRMAPPPGSYNPLSLFGPEHIASSEDDGQRPLLQIFNTFIVIEQEDGISFVDQHSAHERVIYERTMAELRDGKASAQHLLLPVTVDLSSAELDAIEAHKEFLAGIGFELEEFGGNSIILHAVPNPHEKFDARMCFEEIAADLAGNRLGALHDRMERFAATYGCRAAVKAGQRLSQREMQELLRALFACELPPHDVHGRPTIVQLPKEELERRFRRA